MVTKGNAYQNPKGYLHLVQKRNLSIVKKIKKQFDKFGLPNDNLQITVKQ